MLKTFKSEFDCCFCTPKCASRFIDGLEEHVHSWFSTENSVSHLHRSYKEYTSSLTQAKERNKDPSLCPLIPFPSKDLRIWELNKEDLVRNIQVYFCPLVDVWEYTLSSVQYHSLSRVWLFASPWTAACQASLSITNSWSLLKLMSIELVMPSNHLSLCFSLLLLPSIFPSIRVFSNESFLRIR